MNRCLPHEGRRALLAFAASLSFLSLPAAAQVSIQREAPKDVVLGRMTVIAPPSIDMDGREDRLSPGSRIRDLRNMLVLSGSLVGQTVPVVYRRETLTGLVHEVWLLTPEEYRQLAAIRGTSSGEGLKTFIDTLAALWGARR
jgi:hypothetical protein